MTQPQPARENEIRCTRCERLIEVCCFCEDPECRRVICSSCLRLALRESVPVLHEHGG